MQEESTGLGEHPGEQDGPGDPLRAISEVSVVAEVYEIHEREDQQHARVRVPGSEEAGLEVAELPLPTGDEAEQRPPPEAEIGFYGVGRGAATRIAGSAPSSMAG